MQDKSEIFNLVVRNQGTGVEKQTFLDPSSAKNDKLGFLFVEHHLIFGAPQNTAIEVTF